MTEGQFLIIKILQMEKNIKFYVFAAKIMEDSFWLNYQKHLKNKVNNFYTVKDIQSTKLLETIFAERILNIMLPKNGIKLLISFYNNIGLFAKFLSIRDITRLSMVSSKAYEVIHNNDTYKLMHEIKWGRQDLKRTI